MPSLQSSSRSTWRCSGPYWQTRGPRAGGSSTCSPPPPRRRRCWRTRWAACPASAAAPRCSRYRWARVWFSQRVLEAAPPLSARPLLCACPPPGCVGLHTCLRARAELAPPNFGLPPSAGATERHPGGGVRRRAARAAAAAAAERAVCHRGGRVVRGHRSAARSHCSSWTDSCQLLRLFWCLPASFTVGG